MDTFRVRIAKDDVLFSAAHFITLAGGICEPLHGHDYRVTAEVEGPLDENQYVVDFLAVERLLREIIAPWDHQVLLPAHHPRIRVVELEEEVEARFDDRRWLLPRGDCQILPVANTTSELLARHIAANLSARILAETGVCPTLVRIELAESAGYAVACEHRPPPQGVLHNENGL